MYFVYILRCNDNSLYTGITTNLCRRFYEHNFTNKSAKYTKTKRPVKLEYYEVRKTRSEATKRENAIKRLSKEKKENLIYKEKWFIFYFDFFLDDLGFTGQVVIPKSRYIPQKPVNEVKIKAPAKTKNKILNTESKEVLSNARNIKETPAISLKSLSSSLSFRVTFIINLLLII